MSVTRLAVLALVAASGCATEEVLETGEVELASSVWQWTDDVQIPSQSSRYQPALAYYGGRLHMVHSGASSPQELWWSRYNGSSWERNVKLAHTSAAGPALAAYNNGLVMIYRAHNQDRLMMATSNGTQTFGPAVPAGAAPAAQFLRGEPSAAVFGGELYVAYCANYLVRVDRFDGTAWTIALNRALAPTYTCDHVALAVIPNVGLELVQSTSQSGDNMLEISTADGVTWSRVRSTGHRQTSRPISMISCGGVSHLVHGGRSNPSEIWWSERYSGQPDYWGPDFKVPNQASNGGAALGCFGGTRAIMVHNGGTDQLWQSEFGP